VKPKHLDITIAAANAIGAILYAILASLAAMAIDFSHHIAGVQ
jgi:hypothetical protein